MDNKTTEELIEELNFYKQVYETAPKIYFSLDPKTKKIIKCNETMVKKTGYSKEELIGMNISNIYHKDCQLEAKKSLKEFISTGFIKNKRLLLKTKNGDIIPVLLNVSPIKDKDGNILLSNSSLIDITEIVDLENKLNEEKEILKTVLDNIPCIITLSNNNYEIFYSNNYLELITKIKKDEFYGSNWQKYVHPTDIKELMETINNSIKKKKSFKVKIRFINLDDKKYYNYIMNIQPIFDLEQNIKFWLTTNIFIHDSMLIQNIIYDIIESYSNKEDINKIRQNVLDKVVQISDSKYGYISYISYDKDNSTSMQLKTLSTSVYKDIDQQFLEKYNFDKLSNYIFYEKNDAVYNIPLHTKKIFYTNDLQNYKSNKNDNLCPFSPNGYEIKKFLSWPMIYKDKIIGTFGLTGDSDYTDIDIEILNPIVSMLTNIEVLNQLSIELKNEQDEKIKLNQSIATAKSFLLANMSHEIRTPLNGIYGMLTLLSETTDLDNKQKDYIDTCLRSTENLITIIDDILLLSKAESNTMKLEEVYFNLNNLIEDVLAVASSHISKEKKLSLVYIIHPLVPLNLIGDPNKLKQILTNLLNNAIKFTTYGQIVLEITVVEQKYSKNLTLQFEVSDTGIGIQKEDQSKLFQPFNQVDKSTTRKEQGTGLGLSICKKLVECFNGEIWVQSKLGRGSTFYFTIKIQVDNDDQTKNGYGLNSNDIKLLEGKKIIIIDDNSTNCVSLKNLLETFGCIITTTQSSIDGIDIIKTFTLKGNNFDILILDYNMPHLNGNDIIKMVIDMNINLKIILSSSTYLNKHHINKLNVKAFLPKPIRRSELLKTLLEVIIEPFDYEKTPKKSLYNLKNKKDCLKKNNNKCKILLVEDSKINREVMKKYLEECGYETVEALTGISAVDIVLNDPTFNLILMDVHMPIMDGIDASSVIKKNKIDIPIIILTADITDHTKKKCHEIGVDDYILKPVQMDRLFKSIDKVLGNKCNKNLDQCSKDKFMCNDSLNSCVERIKRDKVSLDNCNNQLAEKRTLISSLTQQVENNTQQMKQLQDTLTSCQTQLTKCLTPPPLPPPSQPSRPSLADFMRAEFG